jgi:hypothetical protein
MQQERIEMNTYSMKITGHYLDIGHAVNAFAGENPDAEQALFAGLEKKVLNIGLYPSSEDEDAMIAIANFETTKVLPEDNIQAFASLFPTIKVSTIVVE